MRRATVGNERPVFYKGKIVGSVRERSDVLAMFLLKSRRREIYGERPLLAVNQNIALMTLEQRDPLALALIEDLKAIAADARVIEGQAVEVKSNATDQE